MAESVRVGLAKKHKSQKWLAGELGVSVQFVSFLCTGRKTPSVSMISVIAEVFEVSVSEFIKWGE